MKKEHLFLKKKNILILLFIISILFNLISYVNIQHKERYINRYYEENINNAILSIREANGSIKDIIRLGFTDFKKALNLQECSGELKEASRFLELISVYYDYNERNLGVKGNFDVYKFFRGYKIVLENWAEAIYKNSQEQPSDQDIMDLYKDLQNILNRFDKINHEYTYDELNLLIEELVDETITEDVKSVFKVRFREH